MIPGTAQRVAQSTAQDVNRRIGAEIAKSVRWHAEHPEAIDSRLRELDEEWDIERTLEANASTLAFTGVVLGATVDKRWLAHPALVTAFLFQHAIQGWCPPLPILRRLGFRTMRWPMAFIVWCDLWQWIASPPNISRELGGAHWADRHVDRGLRPARALWDPSPSVQVTGKW